MQYADVGKCLHKELSYEIVGLLFQAHRDKGRFRNEKQYGDYLEVLFQEKGLKYVREYRFEEQQYGKNIARCIVDFIVEDAVVLELKAKDGITKDDYYQLKRYLVTLNLELGMLVNFRQPRLVPKRVLNNVYYRRN